MIFIIYYYFNKRINFKYFYILNKINIKYIKNYE